MAKTAFSAFQKGDSLFRSNHFEQAREFYRKSYEAYQKAGDFSSAGLTLTRLGRAIELMGEYVRAREVYEESLLIFEKTSDLQGIARSKAHVGNVGWATGDYQEASRLLEEALSFYRVSQDTAGEAWVHDLLGNLRLAMREADEAERHYQKAHALVEEAGKGLQVEAWYHYHLGALALFRRQLSEAHERFQMAAAHFTRLKDDLGQVAVLIHLGEIACSQKKLGEAEQHLLKAVRLVLPTQCKPLLADSLTGVSQLLKARGDERKAIGILMVALSHPTCRQQTKDSMVALAMELQSSFSPKEAEEGFRWAKAVSLEEMADAWVSSASPKTKNQKRS